MKKALLVIDVQSYFLREVPGGLPERIAKHIEENHYDTVVFTVFKGEKGSNYERSLHWSSCLDEADLLIPKSLSKFVTKENKFVKSSYSAFFGGELDAYLKRSKIEAVDICGIDLDACVLTTAYGAFDLGYDTKVLFELSHSRFNASKTLHEIINRNIQTKNESR